MRNSATQKVLELHFFQRNLNKTVSFYLIRWKGGLFLLAVQKDQNNSLLQARLVSAQRHKGTGF